MNKRNVVTLILVLAVFGGITVFNTYQDPDKKFRERMEVQREIENSQDLPIKQFTDTIIEQATKKRDEFDKNDALLTQIANGPGMVKTDSGLIYKILKDGSGRKPDATSNVRLFYKGMFLDGKVFDQTHSDPVVFRVDEVIAGWTEGLQLMQEGASWELYIPYELGYGVAGRPPVIPSMSHLKFEVELVKVMD